MEIKKSYYILCTLCYFFIQLLSHVWLFVTRWIAALQRPLDSTISQNLLISLRDLLKFMSIQLVILSNHLFLCHLLPLLLSIFPRVFSNEVALHIKWPKYWNLELQQKSFQWLFQVGFLYDWLVWSPCSPRDSQESSSASQFESISSLPFCLFYGPALISIWLLGKP